jgi:hypothetical protein
MAPMSHRDDSFAQSHFFAFSLISTRQRSRLDRIIVGQSDGRHTFILLGIRADPIKLITRSRFDAGSKLFEMFDSGGKIPNI